jgi:hypothetical protein
MKKKDKEMEWNVMGPFNLNQLKGIIIIIYFI